MRCNISARHNRRPPHGAVSPKSDQVVSRQMRYVVKDLEIEQLINSVECSETADGVARESRKGRKQICSTYNHRATSRLYPSTASPTTRPVRQQDLR
jgi:predicted DNA-binding protein